MEDRDERRYYPAPDFPGKLQQKKMNVGFLLRMDLVICFTGWRTWG